MKPLFDNIYEGRTVLVTGHSGFKGSWLVTWLLELGAKVVGFSLPDPPTVPSNYVVSDLASKITDIRGDIRHLEQLIDVINAHQPEFLFHLAAQPIVLESVAEPKATMDTNAGGTVNVLEAVRQTASVKALICVTTDKVYDNQDWLWGYRETDRLGGHDPYSASKSMAELATSSYRDTFFPASAYDKHGVAVASARAGNVIGGGDFGKFRLIPDCLASLMAGEQIEIRNPTSIRPWQLVLESLSGYLCLGHRLLVDGPAFAEAWNFGPKEMKGVSASELVEKLLTLWGSGSWTHVDPGYAQIETRQLRLSREKAADRLDWRPVYSWEDALVQIVDWFKAYQDSSTSGSCMYEVCRNHIDGYVDRAREQSLPWTGSG